MRPFTSIQIAFQEQEASWCYHHVCALSTEMLYPLLISPQHTSWDTLLTVGTLGVLYSPSACQHQLAWLQSVMSFHELALSTISWYQLINGQNLSFTLPTAPSPIAQLSARLEWYLSFTLPTAPSLLLKSWLDQSEYWLICGILASFEQHPSTSGWCLSCGMVDTGILASMVGSGILASFEQHSSTSGQCLSCGMVGSGILASIEQRHSTSGQCLSCGMADTGVLASIEQHPSTSALVSELWNDRYIQDSIKIGWFGKESLLNFFFCHFLACHGSRS